MKRLITIVICGVVFYGCASHEACNKSLTDQMYIHQQVQRKLDSLEAFTRDTLAVLSERLTTTDSLARENAIRFREYRRNLATYAIPDTVYFCGQSFIFDNSDKRERLEKEFLLLVSNQAQLLLYFRRSEEFFPVIEEMLHESGMPDDLKYVAVIESALKTRAMSYAGASGPWQFLAGTAREQGIKSTGQVDMRRDIEMSTQAAIDKFKVLIGQFGDWALALAAYNMGENGLARRMREQGVSDYFSLWLPEETEAYVFRAIVIKLIFENPGHYGILLDQRTYWERVQKDTITVTFRSGLNVKRVADWCESTFREIKILNPEVTQEAWGSGTFTIKLPFGTRQLFEQGLADLKRKK